MLCGDFEIYTGQKTVAFIPLTQFLEAGDFLHT